MSLAKKNPVEWGARQGYAERSTDGTSGGQWWPVEDLRSLVGADFHGLHAGLGFGPCLEGAVVDDGRCGCRRLLVDDGALFRRRIANNVILGRGLRKGGSNSERCDRTSEQKLFHV